MSETELIKPFRPLSGSTILVAKQLYFAGIFVTDICEELNICVNDLGREVFGADGTGNDPSCWASQKLYRPFSSPVTYEIVKPTLLKKVEFQILNRIRASVTDMEENDELFNIDECSKAMGMVERLDKITRLEEGKPTVHLASEHRTFTLREIVKRQEKPNESITLPPEAFRTREGDSPPSPSGQEPEAPPTTPDSDGGDRNEGDPRPSPQPEDSGVHHEPPPRPRT